MKQKNMYLIARTPADERVRQYVSSMVDSVELYKSQTDAKKSFYWLHDYYLLCEDIVSEIVTHPVENKFANEVMAEFDMEYKAVGLKFHIELIKMYIKE